MKSPDIPRMNVCNRDLPAEAVVHRVRFQDGALSPGGNGAQSESCKGRKPMCRVLAPIRRVRPDHYEPELISFGLYDREYKKSQRPDLMQYLQSYVSKDELAPEIRAELLVELGAEVHHRYQQQHQKVVEPVSPAPKQIKRKKANRMDQQREEVAEKFMEIMKVDEDQMCDEVLPSAELEDIIGLYDDGFLMNPQKARRLLMLDAVFLVSFMLYMYWDCNSTQDKSKKSEKVREIERLFSHFSRFHTPLRTIFDRLGLPCNGHMKRSDLWLLENQIPLSLLRNVLKFVFSARKETTSSSPNNEDGIDSTPHDIVNIDETKADTALKHLVKVAVANVLPQVPGDCSNSKEMLHRMDKVDFNDCEHLLECLYRTVRPEVDDSCSTSQVRPEVDDSRSTSQVTGLRSSKSLSGRIASLIKGSTEEKAPLSKEDLQSILPQHRPKVHLPPVSDLQKAGINVVGDKSRGCTLKFQEASRLTQKATLSLPQLHIDDSTERILRNLVAFESTMSSGITRDQHVLMSYLQCMNDLVNTEEDVRLLMMGNDPVIRLSFLGENKDVAVMFNNLIQHCYFEHTRQSTDLRKQIASPCRMPAAAIKSKNQHCNKLQQLKSGYIKKILTAFFLGILPSGEAPC
ncbi:hypothetical protein AXG93_4142s1280 [Marchantia polymorpha subsp. ruderalis]|uniref:Uncharacterized protein n=1 Tax=Marchantia polymorpha subsp. ruderalis TaxID=1480154 RepID=A0A176WN78_MARPO|nr:hypothetical protein AXG93_4142s1280 [Marchantia polymorpha subsp. ruderalis]